MPGVVGPPAPEGLVQAACGRTGSCVELLGLLPHHGDNLLTPTLDCPGARPAGAGSPRDPLMEKEQFPRRAGRMGETGGLGLQSKGFSGVAFRPHHA